jgi:hypothetical protein
MAASARRRYVRPVGDANGARQAGSARDERVYGFREWQRERGLRMFRLLLDTD